jgi:hypothetical protein
MHEFEQLERRRLLDNDAIGHVRREASSVVAQIESGDAPFCEPWPTWTPRPDWPIPRLTSGWDIVPL